MTHNNRKIRRAHLVVKGYVQGVGFRFFTLQNGTNLHLTGWVRNKFNGNVEILAEGPEIDLYALIQEVRRGPPSAEVHDVNINWDEPQGDLPPFTVLATS